MKLENKKLASSASAPGKLILFGEHAVVYSQPAIAASLSDLRMHALCETRTDGLVVINLPDLRPIPILDYKLPVAVLDSSKTSNDAIMKNPFTPNEDDEVDNEFLLRTLDPLLYLIKTILLPTLTQVKENTLGISFEIKSRALPVGAGLGSSAAFCVAASAALVRLSQIIQAKIIGAEQEHNHTELSSNQTADTERPSNATLEQINQYAFEAEKIINGNPSGVDNYVSCFGGAVYYQKENGGNSKTIGMGTLPQMDILLTNTKVPKSTKKLVANVAERTKKFPNMMHGIFNAIGGISSQFQELMEKRAEINSSLVTNDDVDKMNKDRGLLSNDEYDDIITLVQTNQLLLKAIGVSHPALDAISDITDRRNDGIIAATKLTGAGGGGCAYTLFSPTSSFKQESELSQPQHNFVDKEQMKKRLRDEIEKLSFEQSGYEHFECFESRVGGEGVLWTNPEYYHMEELKLKGNETKSKMKDFPSMLDFNLAV